MIKLFLNIIISLSIYSVLYSQIKQPQWLMPLYFKDASGEKDTVYIGYDPSASSRGVDIDTNFNEGWIKIDTTKFNAYLWQYPYYGPTSILTSDSVRKVDIRGALIGAEIGFVKGKTPVTLKWVDSLLYSPLLPYPDISPRPRARIDFYCESGEPGYINCPIEYEPLSLTDYPTPDIKYPITDSMYFNGSGSNYYTVRRSIFNVLADIVPHNYILDIIYEPVNKEKFNIYPNPLTDYLTITNPNCKKLDIILFSILGQQIIHTITLQSVYRINYDFLEEGIYILLISTSENIFPKRILKIND